MWTRDKIQEVVQLGIPQFTRIQTLLYTASLHLYYTLSCHAVLVRYSVMPGSYR